MVKEKLMEKNDWQQRTELLLGEEKMNRIRKAHVLVVGLGGVGAYAAEMLCRTGVGKMTIVDADTVQPTNMNRQLPAMHSTLGMPKAEVLATRYQDCVQYGSGSKERYLSGPFCRSLGYLSLWTK